MSTHAMWEVTIPGKWILAGEHAVLRGSKALVFPLMSKYLNLKHTASSQDFQLTITGTSCSDIEMIIWSVFEKALSELNAKRSQLKGHLEIHSNIQFGAGMGASATLAVGITLFLKYLRFEIEDSFLFAKTIEDLFHGESSGVDVAVALHRKPMIFKKNAPMKFIEMPTLPLLYLSYSGQRGVTKDCVSKVKKLGIQSPQKAAEIDQIMNDVVEDLIAHQFNLTFEEWILSLNRAQTCFQAWGLVPELVLKHVQILKKHGAHSYKMTGSGNGGYILSLWSQMPPFDLMDFELIPVAR